MKVLKTIKTKSGKELKIYNATLEEMDNEYENRLSFSYEELINSESSESDEIWFQNWRKGELGALKKLNNLQRKKSEGN